MLKEDVANIMQIDVKSFGLNQKDAPDQNKCRRQLNGMTYLDKSKSLCCLPPKILFQNR